MPNDCVFCDKSKFEERLIGETKDFWIIATLGQITDGGYVLLVPKRHVECIGAMEQKEIDIFGNLCVQTFEVNLKEYGIAPGIVLEHGIVGQTIKHAHLHIIPEIVMITDRVLQDFPSCEISGIDSLNALRDIYIDKHQPYLLWKDLWGMKVCWNPPAPPQYLRMVVAEALGRPERGNWRNMDPELDKKLWSETVKRLKHYFS